MVNHKQYILLKLIFLLSILGIIFSAYLVKIHYSENKSLCDINEKFSCSIVNRSEHAEFWGIPVALIGLLGYSFLGLISLGRYKKDFWERRQKSFLINQIISSKSLLFFSILALLISFYLTYTEFFVIKTICLFCLFSQAVILGIVFCGYKNFRLEKEEKNIKINN